MGLESVGRVLLALIQTAGSATESPPPRELSSQASEAVAMVDPDSLRAGLQDMLVLAAKSAREDEASALDSAARLAKVLAQTWGDSFPLRTVALFTAWPPARRGAKLAADSLRRAGNEALSRECPEAALALLLLRLIQA